MLVGPKDPSGGARGVRYHAKERLQENGNTLWVFEEITASMLATQMILVRIAIAKVESRQDVARKLRLVPVQQGQERWNCVSWVRDALRELAASETGIGTSVLDWDTVCAAAMSYCQQKRDQNRFKEEGDFDQTEVATFDLIEQKELIP